MSLVRIDLFVTIDTLVLGIAVFPQFPLLQVLFVEHLGLDQFRIVTAPALDLLMGALELEVGVAVIEGFLIEQDDVGLAPGVIGMTIVAFGLADSRVFAMVTLLDSDVGGNQFVTIETEVTLERLTQQLVAVVAVVFEFDMPLDQWSRHHQFGDIC